MLIRLVWLFYVPNRTASAQMAYVSSVVMGIAQQRMNEIKKKTLHSHKIITLIYATAGCRSIRILFTFSSFFSVFSWFLSVCVCLIFFSVVFFFVGSFTFLTRIFNRTQNAQSFLTIYKCDELLYRWRYAWLR